MNTLYLGSNSPRRMEILTQLGYQVVKLPANIDETVRQNEDPARYVQRMAEEKNRTALTLFCETNGTMPDFPLITADTCVVSAGIILGKPHSQAEAIEFLNRLSGKQHTVLTAVCIHYRGNAENRVQTNRVVFKPLSSEEISAYVQSGEPMDKAGAYAVQGIGSIFIQSIEGSFSGIMGLPVYETVSMLQDLGYRTPPFIRA
ncbi:TPA: Maf family nucleotide pyrophosphatase [Neisseria meningitidis]|uniref:dTTP/UTP pyrophosphatase n=1 Tax=Neisseria meningitidis serogroup A / serotype 4A (strain DSM 15465 / Z2491) TaxID=122587 RepID=NTPPA_NEIMA|nr:Maf family nucleotide pyrophosphatase [Neisseria meningitidis]Q9JVK3.1 RecName: Full=dTTP/UTP pyrophosphatase; Short=dTTPase/UTPase; AltName: Full=Nucleoside triphosphate pyrophosphatase; AltName: Full=Nucleotide pyrophosphatase; Short=Nucleotide PPase [Neisseria meningitidis Z2491]ELK73898.1 septum formation protein Maf [Neisseria meningitidis 63041]ELL05103.1 septum formation protein Maf [Neisseria meningitidis 63049]ELL10654.1 septum formation protein Maf [Neisseria meningitidis 65014]EL